MVVAMDKDAPQMARPTKKTAAAIGVFPAAFFLHAKAQPPEIPVDVLGGTSGMAFFFC
jgi:hypothetical protein